MEQFEKRGHGFDDRRFVPASDRGSQTELFLHLSMAIAMLGKVMKGFGEVICDESVAVGQGVGLPENGLITRAPVFLNPFTSRLTTSSGIYLAPTLGCPGAWGNLGSGVTPHGFALGNSIQNWLPSPGLEFTPTLPRMRSMPLRTMGSPTPVPG
jgi:hypothetical protein